MVPWLSTCSATSKGSDCAPSFPRSVSTALLALGGDGALISVVLCLTLVWGILRGYGCCYWQDFKEPGCGQLRYLPAEDELKCS